MSLETEAIRSKYQLGDDGRDWRVGRAQQDIKTNYPNNGSVIRIGVRPFDMRWSYYTGNSSGFIKCCRNEVSKEMIGRDNYALVLTRNAMPQKPYSNFHIVDSCVVGRYIGDFSTSSQVFPVFSFQSIWGKETRVANFNKEIIASIEEKLGLRFCEEDICDQREGFTANNLINYIFAILNSPKYRTIHKESLCRDFPYIPYPVSQDVFWQLEHVGKTLVETHLGKGTEVDDSRFLSANNTSVTTVKWKNDSVFINNNSRFTNVSEEVWEYWIGGHQIAQKWLKERKGEILSSDDIIQYCKIIKIIETTILLGSDIDKILYPEN